MTETSSDIPAGYADGQPFDRITYLEAKLILKPDQFTSVSTLSSEARKEPDCTR